MGSCETSVADLMVTKSFAKIINKITTVTNFNYDSDGKFMGRMKMAEINFRADGDDPPSDLL